MRSVFRRFLFFCALVGGVFFLTASQPALTQAQEDDFTRLILGEIVDGQNIPVEGVEITAYAANQTLGETISQPDGTFILHLEQKQFDALTLDFQRPHFEEKMVTLSAQEVRRLQNGGTVTIPPLALPRQIGPVFWIVTLLFVAMLAIIAAGHLHNTLAALLGMSLVYAISYLGEPLTEKLFIFQFERSLDYVDWNVIFLIMGMMIGWRFSLINYRAGEFGFCSLF